MRESLVVQGRPISVDGRDCDVKAPSPFRKASCPTSAIFNQPDAVLLRAHDVPVCSPIGKRNSSERRIEMFLETRAYLADRCTMIRIEYICLSRRWETRANTCRRTSTLAAARRVFDCNMSRRKPKHMTASGKVGESCDGVGPAQQPASYLQGYSCGA